MQHRRTRHASLPRFPPSLVQHATAGLVDSAALPARARRHNIGRLSSSAGSALPPNASAVLASAFPRAVAARASALRKRLAAQTARRADQTDYVGIAGKAGKELSHVIHRKSRALTRDVEE
jgi:hypothetical protein